VHDTGIRPTGIVSIASIDDALTALEAVDARASRVVELRFFAGLLEAEAADALGISVSTLKRDCGLRARVAAQPPQRRPRLTELSDPAGAQI